MAYTRANMRILFTRFPLESARGGAEVQTLSLMKGLAARGHAVAFVGSCPVLLEEAARANLIHGELHIGPPPVTKWGVLSFLWRKQKMQKQLEMALEEFGGLDAIVMLSLSEKLLLTEAAVARGTKVFWMEHDRVGRWLTKNPWLPRLRTLSEKATTICVSELSRKIFLDLGWKPQRVVAIPNGIDLAQFEPRMGTKTDTGLKLGCVARLSPEKGVDVLVQAVSGLPEVKLTIVGKGPDEGYLRKLVEQIHASEMTDTPRIRIVPHVEDLGAFYRSIDALVLPSRDNDPFGLVAAEAMACGTPVIVTDQCGIAGYLKDGEDALVVQSDLDRALKDAVTRLMSSSLRARISANGILTAKRLFSLDGMVGEYERLLTTAG